MKTQWILLMLLAVAALSVAGCTSSSPAATPTATSTPVPGGPTITPSPTTLQATTAAVSISGFAFNPKESTIAKGGTVTWTNDDSTAHTVTFADNTGSGQLQNSGNFSKTFDTAGTFDYHCSIHPSMTGKVIVV